MKYPRIASLKTAAEFQHRLSELGIELPFVEDRVYGANSVLGQPLGYNQRSIGNRFAILPMEGWDGTRDGRPSELTQRRWKHFGESGAKLIWGGEAVAVRPDGRANPNQLLINSQTLADLKGLRQILVNAHQNKFGQTDDLFVGLQLTHSGRFANPNEHNKPQPSRVYRHPWLDRDDFNFQEQSILSDDELDLLVDDFVAAAVLAEKAGFEFVDVKHCHGYLGHELLTGFDRPGRYGGSLENRTRFLNGIIDGIRSSCKSLDVGVRLSVFDFVPFKKDKSGIGVPAVSASNWAHAFGGDGTGLDIDLSEPTKVLENLRKRGISLICTTAGCPYYNPHIQRPAYTPPSDGYLPPEDPLVGAARQISVTSKLKSVLDGLIFVGSGYSYLQEWLPHVAAGVIRGGHADFVGLGRMVLSYPELPADVLSGKSLDRKRICRTFSDCTTAPRNGLVSGCYPLDPVYKKMPHREKLVQLRRQV